ncbi:MAG: type II toxin-antitoxin system antitoxin SocA domain-containing protein [Patescibacteria group bacterium]
MIITKEKIGKRIRSIREQVGRSQQDVSDILEIPRVSVSQLEAGKRELTSIELAKLAEYFGVQTDYILSGQDVEQEVEKPKEVEETERIAVPKLKKEKFREVLLYILEKTAGKLNVGQTVLYKLLYFSDFNYYEKFEEQLTGAKYMKNHFGPTPVAFKGVLGEMIESGEVAVDCNKFHGKDQTRYIALRRSNLRAINGAEKEVIDDVLQKLSDMNASQISAYSHDDTPWQIARDGEPIDYEAVFYRSPQYSVKDYEEL